MATAVLVFVAGAIIVLSTTWIVYYTKWSGRSFDAFCDMNKRTIRRTPVAKKRVDALIDNMGVLARHMSDIFPEHPVTRGLRDRFRPESVVPVIHSEHDSESTIQTRQHHSSGTVSYVQNKKTIVLSMGKRVRNCGCYSVVDEVDGLETTDTLMYVLLHLVTLMIRDEIGHTNSFWTDFKFLLEQAEAAGVLRERPNIPQTLSGINTR